MAINLYKNGDFTVSLGIIEMLAKRQDIRAQKLLAVFYYLGENLPQDFSQTAVWIRKAAKQNDAEAQYLLANLYENGKGVPQNLKYAMQWYNTSAALGFKSANRRIEHSKEHKGRNYISKNALSNIEFRDIIRKIRNTFLRLTDIEENTMPFRADVVPHPKERRKKSSDQSSKDDKNKKSYQDISNRLLKVMFQDRPSPVKIRQHWLTWQKRLSDNSRSLSELANKEGITWIGNESISDIINQSIDQICHNSHYSFQKKRTLIYIIAKIASQNKATKQGITIDEVLLNSKIPLHYIDIEGILKQNNIKTHTLRQKLDKNPYIEEVLYKMYLHKKNKSTKLLDELINQEEIIVDIVLKILKTNNEVSLNYLTEIILNSNKITLFTRNAIQHYFHNYLKKNQFFTIYKSIKHGEYFIYPKGKDYFAPISDEIEKTKKYREEDNNVNDKYIKYLESLKIEFNSWAKTSEGLSHKYKEVLYQTPDIFELLLNLKIKNELPKKYIGKIENALEYFMDEFDALPVSIIGPPGYLDDVVLSMLTLNDILDCGYEKVLQVLWKGKTNIIRLIRSSMKHAKEMTGETIYNKLVEQNIRSDVSL
ncbi:hypothetical protein ACFL2E_03090 [Thermodesulfobacteriota bacterium]